MDIQNFLEELEGRGFDFQDKSYTEFGFNDEVLNMVYEMYCAGKEAQKVAVPDGFVVVPKESTQQIYRTFYDAFNSANAGNTAQCFKVAYKAMIEAQEQVDISKFDSYVPMQSRSKE